MVHPKKMAQELSEKDKRIKDLIGEEDFKALLDVRAKRTAADNAKKVKELASKLIGEGGKYHEPYAKADAQAQAIWAKAQVDARKELGLPEPEKETV